MYRTRGYYWIIMNPKGQLRVIIETNHEARLSDLWAVMTGCINWIVNLEGKFTPILQLPTGGPWLTHGNW